MIRTVNVNMSFVKITVEDNKGNRFEFEVDKFLMLIHRHYEVYSVDVPEVLVDTQVEVELTRIKPQPITFSTPEMQVSVPAPKYVPAMGDAADEYCQDLLNKGVYYEKFRWHEVWKRMWAARNK